ncbi:UDP-N-acetylmuramoyl-L-alanyl-D-glutamate--2,6-diaminopimelate ligase [bacterium E08(2017)]|nr:UDP-N-acetylmuramoyl-L-alanyl-D-glutamate--2,6-diaminopimelate ligase [bacterium E08(2017)]
MLLKTLVEACDSGNLGGLPEGAGDVLVTGVSNDSRLVRPGNLYVAVKGFESNGEEYISDALERGASVVVRESAVNVNGHIEIDAKNARLALAELSSRYNGRPDDRLYITGITGTNGKTTTAYLLYRAFEYSGRLPGLLSTVEYRIGERIIPASRTTLDAPSLHKTFDDMLNARCLSVIMEVSSHALDQDRTAFVDFDVAVFTNLTRDHLDYHGTMQEYFEVKKKLFLGLGKGEKSASAVINSDDEWGRKLLASEDIIADKISYSIDGDAAVRVEDLFLSPAGISFMVKSPWGTGKVSSNLLGKHNASNLLAAVSVCCAAGVSIGDACESLSGSVYVPGRLEQVRVEGAVAQVFVDYAHTDDALEKVLVTLKGIADRRLIVVFGCGGERDKSKRPAMGKVAGLWADYCIVTSDNPRGEDPMAIIEDIKVGLNGSANYEVEVDRRAAIRKGLLLAEKGDVLLIAGKGHEGFQELEHTTVPFDDRQVIREEIS